MKNTSLAVVAAAVGAMTASTVVSADQSYVTVFGVLEQNTETGVLSIGGQALLLNQIVPNGSFVRISGVIASNGTFRGEDVLILRSAAPQSYDFVNTRVSRSASAERSVTDSYGTAGVTGSNVAGVTGSNVSGVTGTNVAGVTGSNVAGVTGSNISGVTGTNVAGVTGSNVAGVTGSNISGVTGSNVAGVTGTNVAGVTGTNFQ